MCHWWLHIKPTDKARQGAYRWRQKNRTVYPRCMVSGNRSEGSISSIWLTVPQRSRVSDCSKLQLKGSFILLHKCSRHTGWCLWWHVMHWAGLGCVSECVCCWRAAGFSSSSHYLFFLPSRVTGGFEWSSQCVRYIKWREIIMPWQQTACMCLSR